MTEKKMTGNAGEERAAKYLESKGYSIVTRNFRTRYGELDIIARDGEILAVVEVKTRRDAGFAGASDSVTRKKRARIRKTALWWLAENNDESPVRFDVIEVYSNGDINHIEDAFM
ncbi:MAG: YraN family protein [Oscillospiraceae bacterium]|nr:YraN family protein [Oscillospiraceae bacterium]